MPRPARTLREETVSLREAKANLSRLSRQARDGTRVVITSHRTPVADLVPHGSGKVETREFKRPGPLPKPVRLTGDGPTAAAIVLADRAG